MPGESRPGRSGARFRSRLRATWRRNGHVKPEPSDRNQMSERARVRALGLDRESRLNHALQDVVAANQLMEQRGPKMPKECGKQEQRQNRMRGAQQGEDRRVVRK